MRLSFYPCAASVQDRLLLPVVLRSIHLFALCCFCAWQDNDIMWGGGRPDDITVVVSTVVDTTKNHKPELFAAYTGPGTSAFDWE